MWKMSRYQEVLGEWRKTTIVVDVKNMDDAFRIARMIHKDYTGAQPMTTDEWKEYEGFYYFETANGYSHGVKEKGIK